MRYLLGWLACLVVFAAIAGCRGEVQKATPESGGAGPAKLEIAVIPKSTGEEFWKNVEQGARDACDELGVEMRWEGPTTEMEIAVQNRIIDNMVNLGVDGIALAPLSPKAMAKPVENAVKAGIPVVIFDSAVDGDAQTSFVATNNKQGGRLGAEHLLGLLGQGKHRVMLMRFIQGTASTEARGDGFREAVEKAGQELAAEVWGTDATVAGCKKAAANTFERFLADNRLNLDGIFACNDRSTEGVLEALEDLRKQGVQVNVKLVGFDFGPRLNEALMSGRIDALVVQDPYRMGNTAVKTLVKHLRGEHVEPYIDTGVRVATKEKLEQDPELRKLIGLAE
jgi:ribose transport system substrate-binding protein